jgi:MFS family permease
VKKKLAILLIIIGLFSFAVEIIGPVYAVFVERIGGDLLTAGSSYSIFLISMGIFTYFIGKWENKHRHYGKMLVISHFLIFLGFIGYIFVSSPIHLFIVQIILGMSTALNIPVRDALYTKYMTPGKEALQWSEWESVYIIAGAVGALAGGYIAQFFGFQLLFIVMSTIAFLSFLVALVSFAHSHRTRKRFI